MNRSFKVIGRNKPYDEQKSWQHGEPGVQAKKRIYTSLKDFQRYSPKLIKRYKNLYEVEVYELIDEKWVRMEIPSDESD